MEDILQEQIRENNEWRKNYENRKSKILKNRIQNRKRIEEILKESEKRKKINFIFSPCATSTPKSKNKILTFYFQVLVWNGDLFEHF